MKMPFSLWLVGAGLVVAVALVLGWWSRPAPATRPPIVRTADSVIATRATMATAIAAQRDTDSLAGGRADRHVQHAALVTELAQHLDSAAIAEAAAASVATSLEEQARRWHAAYDTARAEVDTLRRVIADQDSALVDRQLQLAAKEKAFTLADDRRRALEPLVKGLRDSLVAALRPPSRWHWFGITCGGAGTQTSVGLGCSVGPTYTPH